MQNHSSLKHKVKSAKNGSHVVLPYKPPSLPEWDSALPIPRLPFRLAAVVVGLLALLCYCNSIAGEFVFDDTEAILTNDDLKPETPWMDVFHNDFWGKKITKKDSHKSYRPLTVLTFRLNYWLMGGLEPMIFHATNVVLHSLVCILFLHIFSAIFGGYHTDDNGSKIFAAPRASLLAAIFFAVHPIHTESVAGVVGRADLLCALFFFFSFMLYIRACYADAAKNKSYSSVVLVLSSVVCCATAMLFKELGITAIGICSAYDIIVINKVDPMSLIRTLLKHKETSESKTPWLSVLLKRQFILCISAIIMLAYRWYIMGSGAPSFQPVDNPASFADSVVTRIINYNYIYALNCWLLVNPWWLCFDWAMGCIPLIESITDLRILAVFAFWTILGCLLTLALITKPCHEKRILIMGLSLLIIPFLPATNLFFQVGFVIAERQLYLPSVGYCILTVLGLCKLCRYHTKMKKIIMIFVFILMLANMWRSVQRSHEWTNERLLYRSGAKVCPLNAKVHYNIAKNIADSGELDEAIVEYRTAIKLYPEYDQAMNNLANILKDHGELLEAEILLNKAVEIRAEFAAAWMNLGIVQATLKKYELSEKSYYNALKHRRKYPDCYFNLGNLYLERGYHQAALQAWYNATHLKKDHKISWSNIIALLDNTEQYDAALDSARTALQYLPNEHGLYFAMANVYGKAGKYEEAEKHFHKAISLKPDSANYLGNLGVLYHRWEKYEKIKQEAASPKNSNDSKK
uniref:dolichyl-phosphate-mannose--protein mannosyltransferase n=1 Tax=Saccoglossus kowalevskii TaxID=10224 RepID=A0ABM0MHV3_SACKO|nr:PREDICTED: transmembrane and TPR repeat-containing protein 4-like [Saccoglossus kowalevskii]